ncbi:uncharacterized protein LOC114758043 [Neltuma alba]|uniref:uncharacterized protein LOC114745258 n=1 Tax=Neltuma alba TaxID=207710 RepID=UPI0010A3D80A|nr:uncharacterized protein LOC114745258 [Prosopis alba]XP_028802880.1 uncharacterized protein LOC114758043 [Prosopis alba]
MSLSCLTCSQVLQKTDSFREYSSEKPGLRKVRCTPVERTWSGNIALEDQDRRQEPLVKIKREHRRAHSTGSAAFPGSVEPRLVRSPGMRRDWSFEDLAGKNEEGFMCP